MLHMVWNTHLLGFKLYEYIHHFIMRLSNTCFEVLWSDFKCFSYLVPLFFHFVVVIESYCSLTSLSLASQVSVDNCRSGVHSLFPPIPQRHIKGPGGNVPWCAASTPGLVPQELPAAVYAQHPAWWWRAGWVWHSVSNGCDCTSSSSRVLWLTLNNLNDVA